MKQIFAIILMAVFGSSCAQETTADKLEALKANSKSVEPNNSEINPCDLISQMDLIEIVDAPAGSKLNMQNTKRTYPTCICKWEGWTYSAKSTIGGNSREIDYPSEVMMVFVKNASKKMFETSTKAYRDGEPINDVGEMAIWGNTLSQITFLSNGSMIHVHVKTSSDANINKENAIKIAKRMVNNL
jgi:hypothetical protein